MTKNKKEKQAPKKFRVESNPRVNEIVADYPREVTMFPREEFEEQLKKHLIKHGIK